MAMADGTTAVPSDQVQYFLQQHAAGQQIQILQTGNGLAASSGFPQLAQQLLQVQVPAGQVQTSAEGTGSAGGPGQVIQLAGQAAGSGQPGGGQHLQLVHQMNGQDVSQIPISLNAQQLQMIRMQLQGQAGLTGQPILIQAPAGGGAQYQLATGQSGQQFILTSGVGGQAQTVNTQDNQSEQLEENE
jgi:hypothetical protein